MRTIINIFLGTLLITSLFPSVTIFAQNQNSIDDVKRLFARAKTAYSIGEYQDALDEYQKIQQLVPDYPDIYMAIGEVYEKLGGNEDIKAAIENYNQYLRLSPDAQNKETVLEKIASLEYLYEKQIIQTQILDDFSGIWISEAVAEEKESSSTNLPKASKSAKGGYSETYEAAKKKELTSSNKDASKVASFVFKITEIGKEGKFRIEMLPESGFYKESIIQKTVNIVPDRKNSVTFTFADAQAYTPSQSKYDVARLGLSLGNNELLQAVGNVAINSLQESDLPNNTQTAYHFELQYVDGQLKGRCNIIQQKSDPNSSKYTQDDYFEITLKKDDYFYNKLKNEIVVSPWRYKDITGKNLSTQEVDKKIAIYPDIKKQYNSANVNMAIGAMLTSFGGGALIAGLANFENEDSTEENIKSTRKVQNILKISGGGLLAIGLPLFIKGGIIKRNKALKEHNRRVNGQSTTSLDLGITSSGGIGMAFNF